MSQAEDRPSPCSIYKENFDKKIENTRFKRLFPARTPQWVVPPGSRRTAKDGTTQSSPSAP